MNPEPASGSLAWALWFLGEVAFKWVPGAVVSVTGTSPVPTYSSSPTVITDAVSVPQAVQYLQTASAPGVYDQLFLGWSEFVTLSMLISLCLAALIIYCSVRMFQIRQGERRRFAAAQRTIIAHDMPKTQLRWSRIEEEMGSESEKSWRLAILECDIMLNELLDSLGYKGETMADKMRSVDRADFNTIDLAWEAHRFRNRIAHEGTGTPLSHREAQHVVSLYEKVFREFKHIT